MKLRTFKTLQYIRCILHINSSNTMLSSLHDFLFLWQTQKFKDRSLLSLQKKKKLFPWWFSVKFVMLPVWYIMLANWFSCMPACTSTIARVSLTSLKIILTRQWSWRNQHPVVRCCPASWFFQGLILIWKCQKWSLNRGTLAPATAIYQAKCHFTVLNAPFLFLRMLPNDSRLFSAYYNVANIRLFHILKRICLDHCLKVHVLKRVYLD